jgi:adenylate kinase
LIEKEFGCVHISTGDLIRAETKKDNEWSKKALSIMNSGGLLPDEMVNPLLQAKIEEGKNNIFNKIFSRKNE